MLKGKRSQIQKETVTCWIRLPSWKLNWMSPRKPMFKNPAFQTWFFRLKNFRNVVPLLEKCISFWEFFKRLIKVDCHQQTIPNIFPNKKSGHLRNTVQSEPNFTPCHVKNPQAVRSLQPNMEIKPYFDVQGNLDMIISKTL